MLNTSSRYTPKPEFFNAIQRLAKDSLMRENDYLLSLFEQKHLSEEQRKGILAQVSFSEEEVKLLSRKLFCPSFILFSLEGEREAQKASQTKVMKRFTYTLIGIFCIAILSVIVLLYLGSRFN